MLLVAAVQSLCIAQPAIAQQVNPPLTLRQALTLAYRSNPTLLGQQATQRATTENSAQARSGWRPTVTANVNAVYQQGPYTGGQVANKVRAADARSFAAGHALRLTEAQMFQTVIGAYMDVLRDRDILSVRQADLQTLTRQAVLTTSRYNLGGDAARQVTKTDVEQAQSQYDAAEVALAAAQAQLTASTGTRPTCPARQPVRFARQPGAGLLSRPAGKPGTCPRPGGGTGQCRGHRHRALGLEPHDRGDGHARFDRRGFALPHRDVRPGGHGYGDPEPADREWRTI
jgi:outer membrane protein TolC